jgi:ABC-type phosphate transport system substrate-binding protein
MHTVRRTLPSRPRRMRHVRTLIAGATAAAALVLTGLTATAQARPITDVTTTTKSVPAGVATALNLSACPTGDTPSVSSSPALPSSITPIVNGVKSKLAGVWPAPPPSLYTVTVTCSKGGGTLKTKVTVVAAAPENSAIGLGADTQEFLVDQFSGDYNATLTSSSDSHLYNFDATNPVTGAENDTITPKANCASFPRPDGASAGIKQLATFAQTTDKKYYCDNWANSARPRASTDPAYGPGGVAFVNLAGDAVTWATPATTDAPATLTPTQLNAIFTCTDTNWDQVGGKNDPIQPFLPQSGSGTLTFWLAAIGVTTPGPCVSNDNNTLEQNEGVNPVLQTPEAIWIYSVGQYIGQRYHSTACTNSGCTASPPCTPVGGKNAFGCDLRGTYVLKEINGIAPTTGKGTSTVINTSFPSTFLRTLYEVVPYDSNTSDHIPGSESGAPGGVNLEALFGASGWACTSATAKADIKNYGFVPLSTCGLTS